MCSVWRRTDEGFRIVLICQVMDEHMCSVCGRTDKVLRAVLTCQVMDELTTKLSIT